uniref:Cullin-1 n=1 Tax=Cryptococcus bacillisporus CA1280 TaxID=1296109 RepID=A0A0D0TEG0_CRYGA|nr:Cullin 1 [Cryptococcus bacillisporus CA1280]
MSASASGSSWTEPTKAQAPPKDADLRQAWDFLSVGVDHIMTRLSYGMSYSYYILLYTAIYNYCTQPGKTGLPSFSPQRGGASLQGADLHRSLHNWLSVHCKSMREEAEKLPDQELLKYYARQWDRYTRGALYVNKLFNYLNKHWVKREKEEGRKDVYQVYTLALVSWKNNFFDHFADSKGTSRLTQAVLRQIQQQRNGEEIDSGLLKKVIDSYVSLGLDEADAQRQNLDTYKRHFQTQFLEATDTYYRAESSAFVDSNSVSDYMKKAEARLQEEADRVNLYLHDNTRNDLKTRCEKVLIEEHQAIMWDEFQTLLDSDRVDDLARMYGLLSRVLNGLDPLREKFGQHVRRAGRAAVEKVLPAPGAVNEAGKAESLDPKAYIEVLLEVHGKYTSMVEGPFRGEMGFNRALDQACGDFCNSNAACTVSTKSPELLASYCDLLLRKSNKDSDAESLEASLSKAMIIFNFIDDKDVFHKFYQKKLAQRLVGSLSASDDAESSMITKLKELSGFEYTNKLSKMFTDVNLSKDLMERFNEREREKGVASDIDFQPLVLGSNSWPLHPQQTDFAIPREIQALYDRFNAFHGEVHQGRTLNWLWHISKNELRTTYLNQKYILMTSAYQMAILTQFNVSDTLSYKDIEAGTKLSPTVLKPQLGLLVKLKILLNTDEEYSLNMGFKSKKIRVNLNQTIKSEARAEQKEVIAAVDEDRKFVYQATIVRLMKGRKTMQHQALIQEVTAQISSKFTPKIPEIKKAIEYLIDKEYLERAPDSNNTYNYLA